MHVNHETGKGGEATLKQFFLRLFFFWQKIASEILALDQLIYIGMLINLVILWGWIPSKADAIQINNKITHRRRIASISPNKTDTTHAHH